MFFFQFDVVLSFEGDKEKLGNAEKFFLLLHQVPFHRLRIEGMLLKSEFGPIVGGILPNIRTIIDISEILLADESLTEFLRFALHAGNFINAVG